MAASLRAARRRAWVAGGEGTPGTEDVDRHRPRTDTPSPSARWPINAAEAICGRLTRPAALDLVPARLARLEPPGRGRLTAQE